MPRNKPTPADRVYLGDGAYAEIQHDVQAVVLTTSDGVNDTNQIYLEIETLDALIQFLRRHGVKLPVSGKV